MKTVEFKKIKNKVDESRTSYYLWCSTVLDRVIPHHAAKHENSRNLKSYAWDYEKDKIMAWAGMLVMIFLLLHVCDEALRTKIWSHVRKQ